MSYQLHLVMAVCSIFQSRRGRIIWGQWGLRECVCVCVFLRVFLCRPAHVIWGKRGGLEFFISCPRFCRVRTRVCFPLYCCIVLLPVFSPSACRRKICRLSPVAWTRSCVSILFLFCLFFPGAARERARERRAKTCACGGSGSVKGRLFFFSLSRMYACRTFFWNKISQLVVAQF